MKKTIKRISLAFLILAAVYFYSFPLSFIFLMYEVEEWWSYNYDLTDEIEMERALTITDCEAWRIHYGFPLTPYARMQAKFEDDGSMTADEVEKKAKEIAAVSDEKYGGHKTIVNVEHDQGTYMSTYCIVFKKRCVSPFKLS